MYRLDRSRWQEQLRLCFSLGRYHDIARDAGDSYRSGPLILLYACKNGGVVEGEVGSVVLSMEGADAALLLSRSSQTFPDTLVEAIFEQPTCGVGNWPGQIVLRC